MTRHPLPLQAIRALEQLALSQRLPLMQRAGQCAAEFVMQRFQPDTHIILLVGPGNNGGDALATGLLLHQHGYRVQAIMPRPSLATARDAQQVLAQWHAMSLRLESKPPHDTDDLSPMLLIDGLFGIGLNRELNQPWQGLIDWANKQNAHILALDIPSGIMADTATLLGRPIKADWTLAFIAASFAMYEPKAQPFVGQCEVCTLGLI